MVALLLGGCSFAPGMYVGKSLFDEPNKPGGDFLISAARPGAAAHAPAQSTSGEADTPPPGALIPITADLVRQQRAAQPADVTTDVRQLFGTAKPYTIGAGDVLNIVVWDHPELALAPAGGTTATADPSQTPVGNGYNVNPDGLVQFPYIGAVPVAGLTELQARELLTQRLAVYIKNPQITVRIQAYRSGRIYIDGEVRSPGLQSLNDIPMTLPEALGRAGGFTAAADRAAIALTRNQVTTVISLPQLTERGINPANILLGNGDLVRVLSRDESKVFVLGEVLRPATQTLRNGRLTLNEALSDSGGINPASADPRQIFVVRAANPEKPEIFHLDARSPVAYALAEGFELKARDVVYVDPVPLVRWNRVISLILPSAQAVSATRSAVN